MNAPLRPSQPPPAIVAPPTVYAALVDAHGATVVVARSLLARRVRVMIDGTEALLSPAAARELADALDAAAACVEGV